MPCWHHSTPIPCAGFSQVESLAYLTASMLCIGAIACLANQKTARLGASPGAAGLLRRLPHGLALGERARGGMTAKEEEQRGPFVPWRTVLASVLIRCCHRRRLAPCRQHAGPDGGVHWAGGHGGRAACLARDLCSDWR